MTPAAYWATASALALNSGILWTFIAALAIAFTVGFVGVITWRRWLERQLDAIDWAADNDYGPVALADETPIYSATAEHIARMEAADLDDEWMRICDATGGAA